MDKKCEMDSVNGAEVGLYSSGLAESFGKGEQSIDSMARLVGERGYDKVHAQEESSLSLAFLGDAVWSLLVRDYFCNKTTFKNNNLHKLCTKFVKASFQAQAVESVMNDLTEEELGVFRRARNTKMATVSKNSSLADYKYATGFEALLGYHYLAGNFERIQWIFERFTGCMDEALMLFEKGKNK
ncbi:MAG: Mini-ribonuclease 3 [Christensenellales bacterium]